MASKIKKNEKTPKKQSKVKGLAKKSGGSKKTQPKARKAAAKPVKEEKIDKRETADTVEEAALKSEQKKKGNYYYAVGRRKSAIAKVFLLKNGEGVIKINGKELKEYLPWPLYRAEVEAPLLAVGQKDRLDVKCIVKGGGAHAQAQAVRMGIARALLNLNPVFRRALKKHSYLTRDSRKKERKKYGLKGARRAPQWKKR